MPVYRLAIVLTLLAGCASTASVREVFEAARSDLSPSQEGSLLETMEIISLLEEYLGALEARDGERLSALLSEDFHYGEHDRAWFREKKEREFFRPYSSLRATVSGVRLFVVRRDSSPWIRQDGFDWLNGPGGERTFPRSYLISARGSSPFSVLIPAGPPSVAPPAAGVGGRPARPAPVAVAVQFVDDPSALSPMGEASFRLALAGRREGGGEVAVEEGAVLLLEKEGGKWRIVSVE